MTDAGEWRGRVGESWAAEWRRTDRSFGPLTERLLQRSREFTYSRVLDVGCGAGELSLALGRAQRQARVTGIDISAQLIAAASGRAANLGNACFELADAATWQPAEGKAPDFVVSRHGVMFFDDPVGAFTHLCEVAVPGAALMFSCFRDRAENPFFTEPARQLPHAEPLPSPDTPGPFAFADRTRVEAILLQAGWRQIAFEPYDFPMVIGLGADPVEEAVAYLTVIGPAARAARELGGDERARFVERLRALAERHLHDGIVALRAAAWIVTARKP